MVVLRKYQTFWPRFWAGCIDALVFSPLYFVDSWIGGLRGLPVVLVAWFILYTFSFDAYSVLMHARYGQTLGKMVVGVRVLDLSEARLSFRQALLRDIVPIIFSVVTVVNGAPLVLNGMDPYAHTTEFTLVDKIWVFGSLIWFVAELATMLTNTRRRAVHDFIAGSVVVRVEAEATRNAAAA